MVVPMGQPGHCVAVVQPKQARTPLRSGFSASMRVPKRALAWDAQQGVCVQRGMTDNSSA
jgi:hypothetical protein